MQVILKPTTACNGTCVYCAAGSTLFGHPFLPKDRLADVFRPLAAWLRADPKRHLGIIWHGGEPLLPGLEYYRTAQREQQRAFGDDLERVRNQVQSNLTLVTEEWVPFIHEFFRGEMGSSYDLVDGIRGLRNGESLAERWLRALEVCRKGGIKVSVVYVAHRKALPLARSIYQFFRNVLPNACMRVNPLYREGRATDPGADALSIEPKEYARFLLDMAEAWWPERDRVKLLPLGEWHAAWKGDTRQLCCDSGGRCQETHLGICPDGTAYGCGRASDSYAPELRLGNIFDDDVDTLMQHPVRAHLVRRIGLLREGHCAPCPYWSVCHGGCPMDARIYYGDALRETWFCEGRRRIFDYFTERMGPLPSAAGVAGAGPVEALR